MNSRDITFWSSALQTSPNCSTVTSNGKLKGVPISSPESDLKRAVMVVGGSGGDISILILLKIYNTMQITLLF